MSQGRAPPTPHSETQICTWSQILQQHQHQQISYHLILTQQQKYRVAIKNHGKTQLVTFFFLPFVY